MSFLRQLGWELWKMFARPRTWIGFGAFLVVQITILLLLQLPKAQRAMTGMLEKNGYVAEQYMGGLTLAVAIIVFTFVLLGGLYIALVGGDIVAKEVEDGTMRLVLCRPVGRVRLLTVKWLACLIYTLLLVVFLGVTALLAATLYRGHLGKLFIMAPEEGIFSVFDTAEALWRYARAIGFLGLCALSIAGLAFMFSCFRLKPAAATILTLSVLFLDLVVRNIPYFQDYRHWFISYHNACWVRTLAEPVRWPSVVQSLIFLATFNVSCFVIGLLRFCTRDLKS